MLIVLVGLGCMGWFKVYLGLVLGLFSVILGFVYANQSGATRTFFYAQKASHEILDNMFVSSCEMTE